MTATPRRTLALLTGAIAALLSITANAQVPIKSVDEPGRTPYIQTTAFKQDASNCNKYGCTIKFPAIPLGYRLVVTHASALFTLTNGGNFAVVNLNTANFAGFGMLLDAPRQVAPNVYLTSSQVSYYVEPGGIPSLLLTGVYIDLVDGNYVQAALVGYLVAITPPPPPAGHVD